MREGRASVSRTRRRKVLYLKWYYSLIRHHSILITEQESNWLDVCFFMRSWTVFFSSSFFIFLSRAFLSNVDCMTCPPLLFVVFHVQFLPQDLLLLHVTFSRRNNDVSMRHKQKRSKDTRLLHVFFQSHLTSQKETERKGGRRVIMMIMLGKRVFKEDTFLFFFTRSWWRKE